MKVSIDELKTLPLQKLSAPFNEKLDGLDAVKPVLGEITISYSASGVLLTGRVKTLLKLECDRCLRPYFQALSLDIEEKFVSHEYLMEDPDTKEREPHRELHNDDFFEPIPPNGILDISDVVYQAVTLATPSFKTCGEECPGPPGAGERAGDRAAVGGKESGRSGQNDKPIDPRWKNLKTLFPNEDSQQNS